LKTLLSIILVLMISTAYAATKCERDYGGAVCCWDIDTEGPFRPINC